jgi:uncharacterized membrane protein YkgB
VATAILASQATTFILGSVFFVCSVGSLIAIRQAQAAHVGGILLLSWLITMGAMLATVPSTAGELLGPLYFVCMIGSLVTAQRAYQVHQ